jgi:hypothetical protein
LVAKIANLLRLGNGIIPVNKAAVKLSFAVFAHCDDPSVFLLVDAAVWTPSPVLVA